jgi:hypothetical protein
MAKRKQTLKDMESIHEKTKSLDEWNADYLDRNQYSNDWDELDSWISHMAKSLKTNWSQDLQSECDRAIGWRGGLKRGWDNACLYYIDLIKEVRTEEPNEEKDMSEEPKYYSDTQENYTQTQGETPNYTEKHWELILTKDQWYEKLDSYEGIAYGPMLNMSWTNFSAMIDDYCEDRKCKGKWLTNEWGTQSFIFKRKKVKKKTTKKKTKK